MELEERIKEVLSFYNSQKVWKNNFVSQEWIKLNRLSIDLKIGGLNRNKNCGCIEDNYRYLKLLIIDKNKIQLKKTQMESKFKLKENKVIYFPKYSIHLTNANLTDALASELLRLYPAHKSSFATIPATPTVVMPKKEALKEVELPKNVVFVSKEVPAKEVFIPKKHKGKKGKR